MHAQNTARRILRQLIDRAPQARDVEIMLMEPYYQEVGLLPPQKLNNCFYRLAFDQVTFEFDAVTLHLDACFFLKFLVEPQLILLEHSRQRGIGGSGKRSIRRKILHSGDGKQFCLQAGGEPDGCHQGPLGLGRLVIRGNNFSKHGSLRLLWSDRAIAMLFVVVFT